MPTPSPIVSCSTSATELSEPRIPPSRSAAVTNAASAGLRADRYLDHRCFPPALPIRPERRRHDGGRFGAAQGASVAWTDASGAAPSTSRRSAARRTRSTRTSWSARSWPTGSTPVDVAGAGRPRRGQHLRLHRGGPAGVDRHRARARRPQGRAAPSSSSPAAWPSATATSWPRRCPRSTRWPASACRSPSAASPAAAAAQLRPAEPAPPAGRRAVGVREGGRGLRPGVRVLRHPELPRPAALAVDRRRSSTRSTQLAASGVQEIVLVAQDLASYGRDQGVGHQGDRPAGRGGGRPRAAGCGCSTCTRPTSRAARRRDARHRRAVLRPVAAARVRARCCAACAGGATATGSSRASTTIRAQRARRRLPVELHRRLPGRDRGRPRPAARLRRGRPARLVRLLRLLPGGRHLRRRPRRRGARGPRRRAAGRAARAPGRHHRRPT